MITKLTKFLQILTCAVFILMPISGFSQSNYSIDNEKHMKSQRSKRVKPTREDRRIMKIEDATIKKDKKKDKNDRKLHKKAVRKHNKKINGGGKDLVGGKRTWKRMKKSKRESVKNSR
ncbi:MAG: hypothetical protein PHP52_03110 [Bacteroidales bacterium]|jgi:hypothetical protein|nr:hypothetical protein [Bacteroidales bacterium]MDD4216228.1 hypothetical protein [Bacteroidales bacterium]MDY0141386.1 hypothetical protein [Bacteroidales bacterium]